MRIDVLTIFPEYLDPLRHALLGRAIERDILQVGVHNLRNWAHDVHRAVDDTPFGGGPGMVMKPEVWGPALDDVAGLTGPARAEVLLESASPHTRRGLRVGKPGMAERSDSADHLAPGCALSPGVAEVTGDAGSTDSGGGADARPVLVVPTPTGRPFTQEMAQRWAEADRLVFACGRYEGIDQRVFTDAERRYRVEEVSLGDYVLIGGEVAVLVIAEAVVRLIPGVLGNQVSHAEDSFQDGLLEGPSYTKPRVWRGLEVPEVLTSGDHGKVARWRRDQSLHRTLSARPDLLAALDHGEGEREEGTPARLDSADRRTLSAVAERGPWADPSVRLDDGPVGDGARDN